MNRKEEIIYATLELASVNGLGRISMSQIANKVGIKKASIYNHFKSKEILINQMYEYIRDKSKDNITLNDIESAEFIKKSNAKEILTRAVSNYKNMINDEKMLLFYTVIYCERSINPTAAEILTRETTKMINATKKLFHILQENDKIKCDNIEMTATSFAMTIHSLIDYELDCKKADVEYDENMIEKYIDWFSSTWRL